MGCVAGGVVVSGVCGRGRGGEWDVWQGAWW